jgi:hypothetical protein
MYKYKYQKYIDKIDKLMGGNNGLIYLLVTTEFKKTEQRLGKLEDFSKKTSELISEIDDYLLDVVNRLPNITFPRDDRHSPIILEIRRIFELKKELEESVLEKIRSFYVRVGNDTEENISIDIFAKFATSIENRDEVIRIMGLVNYRNFMLDLEKIKMMKLEYNTLSQNIKMEKEEDKERIKILQLELEENAVRESGIERIYNDNIIKGAEFRAIILNHHFMLEPYIHVVYTVLKYDIIKKSIYVDLFVSNKQYIKAGSIRDKDFIPKMFDENMRESKFTDIYAAKIYEIMKQDVSDIYLLHNRLAVLNNYIYMESREHIDFSRDRIRLKLQKNFLQYLYGQEPIDDNQTKVKLCNLRIPPSLTADPAYQFVIDNTKRIVREKGILAEKSYTVIATSIELLKRGEIHEKQGEEDKHAEAILIEKYHRDDVIMNHFKTDDLIYVIRLYQNGNIGCGLPCNRCFQVLRGNGINRVIYSMDADHFRILNMDETTYTYTTTGNKLLNIDLYLYDNYIVPKRIRDE